LSTTLTQIKALVVRGAVRISDHGYDELAKDDISVGDILAGLAGAVVVDVGFSALAVRLLADAGGGSLAGGGGLGGP
jgi:hypothetical protein